MGNEGAPRTVLIATDKPFAKEAVAGIEQVFAEAGPAYRVEKCEKYTDRQQLLDAAKGASAMIIRSDLAHQDLFDIAKDLKIVVRAGAGVDNIDLAAATSANVVAMNTPGQNSNAVAELAFGLMLRHARNQYDGTSGSELRGKRLGLHGCGAVGRCMMGLAQGFGMTVVGFDPFLKPEQITANGAHVSAAASLQEVFECNFVSLHIPATPETKKSIGKDLLLRLPKGGVLLNTARKEVVDEEAMIAAFGERPDLGYLCDVGFDSTAQFKDALGGAFDQRVFFTPKKMGAQTAEANSNAGIAAARQIVAFFESGDVRFQVNKPGQTF